jgi:hypothetical protein
MLQHSQRMVPNLHSSSERRPVATVLGMDSIVASGHISEESSATFQKNITLKSKNMLRQRMQRKSLFKHTSAACWEITVSFLGLDLLSTACFRVVQNVSLSLSYWGLCEAVYVEVHYRLVQRQDTSHHR